MIRIQGTDNDNRPRTNERKTSIHNLGVLIKNPVREQDKGEVAKKLKLHQAIMSRDNKSLEPLTYATYEKFFSK